MSITCKSLIKATVAISSLCIASQAYAAEAPKAEAPKGEDDDKDIVVTGTLIRGIAPGGSQSIAVDQSKIATIGAVNTSELLANVPQAGTFLSIFGAVRSSFGVSISVNRPSLRYLGNTGASSASTLILVDGHRMPGMGIRQSSADLDAISPNSVERVDVITDGGSSTYGSDAVGGVINFITRKSFDGVEAKASYGFADNYNQYNASIIAGKTFGNVSAYVAYDFSKHSGLLGLDRDFSQNRDWINNVPGQVACPVGNVRATVGGVTTTFALPGLTPGLGNRCDNSEYASLYPDEEKHSVMASVVVDSGGPVSFSVKAYYVHRTDNSTSGPPALVSGVTVRNTSPYFIPLPGAPTSELFFVNLSSVFGNFSAADNSLESYGITPSVKWDIGSGWQMNAMFNYGIGKGALRAQQLNAAEITVPALAGTFDPVNLANPVNAPALAKARDWFSFGRAKHDLVNARAIFDGPLFDLPGGKVRAAIGAEYLRESFAGFSQPGLSLTAASIAALADRKAARYIKSIFGELNVPLMGEGSGIGDLTVSLSGRYDHYSDFGGTFNPKIGVNFSPVDWLKLRGNWGTAFQAAGISVLAEPPPSFTISSQLNQPNAKAGLPITTTRINVIPFSGAKLPVDPQTAETWSLGFDIKPPAMEGFSAGLTYYSIDFKNIISALSTVSPRLYIDYLDRIVTYDAGDAALRAFFDQLGGVNAGNGAQVLASLPNNDFSSVYSVVDSRASNLGRVQTTGLDFYARLRHETGFGDVFADVSGNYILTFNQQASPAAPIVSTIGLDTTKLRLQTTLGTNIGNLLAQVVWNHSQGYDTTPNAANLQQSRVDSFNLFNLYFRYNMPGESKIAKDLTFSLHVDNVFDQDPPLYRGTVSTFSGFANGFTLGRLVRFGVTKKF